MRKSAKRITACPRLFADFLSFGSGKRERRVINADIKRSSSGSFSFRGVYLLLYFLVWSCIWLFPSTALAEFDSGDSSNLNTIRVEVQSLEVRQEWIFDYLVGALGGNMNSGSQTPYYVPAIYQQLQTLSSSLGFTPTNTLDGKISTLVNNSEDNLDYLQRIEDLLTNIESALDSGTGSGSGSGSSDLPWAKETTLQSYKEDFATYSDNFQTYYDWIKESFGFSENSSSNSPTSFVDMFTTHFYTIPNGIRFYKFNDMEQVGASKTPFPGSSYTWVNEYPDYEYNTSLSRYTFTFPELLSLPIVAQLSQNSINEIKMFKKSAWNDWQAHTNLVATLERLLDYQPPESRVDSSSDFGTISSGQNGGEVLTIDYDNGPSGGNVEEIDLTPAYTNDVGQLTVDANTITNDFNDIWHYTNIKNRYIDEAKIVTSSRFYDVTPQEVADYTISYGDKPYMKFRWTSTSLKFYKAIFTYERMRILRETFGRMWQLLVIWGCYVLFRILGKANS